MGLSSVIHRFAETIGIEDSELDELLAEVEIGDDLSPLSGSATEAIEIFSGGVELAEKTDDGLLWYPIIRAGQWAVRPGPRGQKVRRKLRVVAGRSKDARKELGLADLLDAFNEDAVENVTVPVQTGAIPGHANLTLQNSGFIAKMKIADMEVKKGPQKGKQVKTLFGGYEITEPDIKGKLERGTIAGRSAGLLYDYTNTETGKTWPAVVEHVLLTNKPWITGMTPAGRRLNAATDLAWESMLLSDEDPGEVEGEPLAGDEVAVEIEGLQEGDATVTWTHEDSPNWMRQQINDILDKARREKLESRRKGSKDSGLYVYESVPSYRVTEAKPGKALICDRWGEGANYWVAGFKVEDGQVELDEFDDWQAVKSVYVADDRDPPDPKDEPLDDGPSSVSVELDNSPQGQLHLAQSQRKQKADSWNGSPSNYTDAQYSAATALDRGPQAGSTKQRYGLPFKTPSGRVHPQGVRSAVAALLGARGGVKGASPEQRRAAARKLVSAAGQVGVEVSDRLKALAGQKTSKTNMQSTHPRGGEHMAGENSGTLQLSEEAQQALEDLQVRLAEERQRNEQLTETVDRLSGTVQQNAVDEKLAWFRGIGFSEERGFTGFLTSLREVMLADDHKPAIVSEAFSDDGKTETALTITEAFERVFKAIELGEDGKLKFGEQIVQPSDEEDGDKRPKDEGDGPKMSTEEKVDRLVLSDSEAAASMGYDQESIEKLRQKYAAKDAAGNGSEGGGS